jgi:4-hydroxybenzoate polyprenyltransferase
MGAFLTYEVARKLDPQAHPVLRTYLGVYGARRTIALMVTLQALTVACAAMLGFVFPVWPCAVLVWASLVVLRLQPQRFKAVELIASVSFLVEIWSPFLARFLL